MLNDAHAWSPFLSLISSRASSTCLLWSCEQPKSRQPSSDPPAGFIKSITHVTSQLSSDFRKRWRLSLERSCTNFIIRINSKHQVFLKASSASSSGRKRHFPNFPIRTWLAESEKHFFSTPNPSNDCQSSVISEGLSLQLLLHVPLHLHSSPSLYLSFALFAHSSCSPSHLSSPSSSVPILPLSRSISIVSFIFLALPVLFFTQRVHWRCG